MSRLTELLGKATPRPWIAERIEWAEKDGYYGASRINDPDGDDLTQFHSDYEWAAIDIDDAAIITALVNHAEQIQQLWEAAESALYSEMLDDADWAWVKQAVEALRDLCGEQQVKP